MAVQTIYILATTAVTPNWFGNTQLNGSAPTGANTAYGWVPGTTTVTTPYRRGRLGATTTGTDAAVSSSYNAGTSGPTKGTGSGATTAGDSFIAGPFTGIFAATAWTMNWNLRASTAGAVGHVNVRVWKSANADGSSATQLMANTVGATVTLSTTVDRNSSISWSPGALTLNNEYLFFQVEWQETTAGSSSSNNVFFRAGTAAITTPNLAFLGSATLAGAGGLTADLTQVSPPVGPGSSVTFSNNVLHYTADATGGLASAETLLHFAGASGSTTITDDTGKHTWTATAGGPQLSTAQSKFGGSALSAAGAGYVGGDGTIGWGTNDWTVDFWIYRTGSAADNLFSSTTYDNPIYVNGTTQFLTFNWGYYGGDKIVGNTVVTSNAWHHVAMVRQGAYLYLFLDGQLQGTPWNIGTTFDWFTSPAGYPQFAGQQYGVVSGYLDELRILIGTAVWTSNFTPPTVAYGIGTIVADTSGYNNTGYIQGTGTTLALGQIGQALSFNGSGSVAFSDTSLLGLPTATSEFSASVWVKTTAITAALISLRDTGTFGGILSLTIGYNGLNGNAGAPNVLLWASNGGGGISSLVSTTTVNDNNWHHLAFTRNSSQLVTLYIDGVSNTSFTDPLTSGIAPLVADSAIGQDLLNGGIAPIVGALDDLQIYNRALTSTEVSTIYVAGITPLAPPVQFMYTKRRFIFLTR